jgi:hypothetical protein
MTTTLEQPRTVQLARGGDAGGDCHIISSVTDRPLCGGPVAPDSPGIHDSTPGLNPCDGCGRPRCQACEAQR